MSDALPEDRVDPLRLVEIQRQKAPPNNLPTDPSTEASRGAIEAFIAHELDERKIVTSTRIVRALDQAGIDEYADVTAQEIGRTLGAYIEGDVEDESFASDVEISIYRDANQTVWQLDRVAGQPADQSRTMFLDELIEAIDATVDAELTQTDGDYRITREWMRDVTRTLVEATDASEEQLEAIEGATKRGLTEILTRHTPVEVDGARDQWSKSALLDIHDLITGGDQA